MAQRYLIMETITLYTKRPENCSNRLEKEIRCYDLLDSLGIEYIRADHEAAETMAVCEEIDKTLGAAICKNLFLCNKQQTMFYLLMMPGEKPFKTKLLSKQIGSSRLSFATAAHMEELLDITPGSVSIMGLMNDHEKKVRLLVDRDILNGEFVGCHPCTNTSSLKIRTADMFGPLLRAMEHSATVVDLPWEIPEE